MNILSFDIGENKYLIITTIRCVNHQIVMVLYSLHLERYLDQTVYIDKSK